MRLAICSVGELFGGVERQILDLCTFLRRRGLGDPLVTLFHDRELAAQLRRGGLAPVILQGGSRYDWRLVARLTGLLAEHRIDVVHAHGYKATIAAALAKRRLGFRLVKTEHGKREATLAHPVAWLKARANLGLDGFLTRRYADQVLYVTHDIQAHFAAPHRGLVRATVHNGIDPLSAAATTRPADLPADRFNVALVGRVTAVKGIPLALAAMAGDEVPPEVHLVVIGTGPLLASLQREAAERGLSDRVSFLGFRQNIYDYLAHVDVLLMPSYHEGLPYTLLEAMSLARPVVASRVGGLAEVLRDGETGLLVEPGATDQIAAAVGRLARDRDLGRALGRAAQDLQARRFTLDVMGQGCLDAYVGA